MRRGTLTGLAAVSEAREDWKARRRGCRPGSSSSPSKVGPATIGRALFMLGKPDDAFATLTEAVKDTRTRIGRRLDGPALYPEG